MIARGEAMWVASQCVSEVGHTGFDDGLNVKDKSRQVPGMTPGLLP